MVRLIILALAIVASSTLAIAHSWYDYDCCHDRDCWPLPAFSVEATSQGWKILETGETIPFSQARKSKDDDFHICRRGGKKDGEIICLYAPPMGI